MVTPLGLELFAAQARQALETRTDLPKWMASAGYGRGRGTGASMISRQLFRSVATLGPPARLVLMLTGAMGGALALPEIYRLLTEPWTRESDLHATIGTVLGARTVAALAGG